MAVHEILRSQFPNIQGFQNPLKGQNLSFQRLNGSFIQIIHADGNHWITIEGVHASFVRVYDSVYRSTTDSTKMQIASMMSTNARASSEKHIDIQIQHTQFQQGETECGVYAIAFAVEMCFGNNPASYRYTYSMHACMQLVMTCHIMGVVTAIAAQEMNFSPRHIFCVYIQYPCSNNTCMHAVHNRILKRNSLLCDRLYFRYDQSKMRDHLSQCFSDKRMERFPSYFTRALPPVKKEKVYLYCTCRMPEGDGNIAFCPKCKEWYHQVCDNIPDFIFDEKRKSKYYICHRCC